MAAVAEGVKTPLRWWPFAWAEGVRWMVWSREGMRTWTETGVLSKDLLERADEVFGGLEGSGVGRERHFGELGGTEEFECCLYGSVNCFLGPRKLTREIKLAKLEMKMRRDRDLNFGLTGHEVYLYLSYPQNTSL